MLVTPKRILDGDEAFAFLLVCIICNSASFSSSTNSCIVINIGYPVKENDLHKTSCIPVQQYIGVFFFSRGNALLFSNATLKPTSSHINCSFQQTEVEKSKTKRQLTWNKNDNVTKKDKNKNKIIVLFTSLFTSHTLVNFCSSFDSTVNIINNIIPHFLANVKGALLWICLST